MGDILAGIIGGLSPHLDDVYKRRQDEKLRLDILKRKDEDELIDQLSKSENPELRSLAIAARLERATTDRTGKGGKKSAGASKKPSILDTYVSQDNTWREHPIYQQVAQIQAPLISMGDELANMSEAGMARDPRGAGANAGGGIGTPPPSAAPSPVAAAPPLPSLAQPVGSPTDRTGQMNAQAVQTGMVGAPPPEAPTPRTPSPPSFASPGQPIGSGAPQAPRRSDPYAATLEAGFRPDALGGLGPMGEMVFKTELGGQVTEKQRFAEEQRGERARATALAKVEELRARHANELEKITLKTDARRSLEGFRQDRMDSRKRIASPSSGGGALTGRDLEKTRLQAKRDFDNDMDKLDGERDRMLADIAKERLIDPADRARLQQEVERRVERRRQDVRGRYDEYLKEISGVKVGAPPPGMAAPPPGPPSTAPAGGKAGGGGGKSPQAGKSRLKYNPATGKIE